LVARVASEIASRAAETGTDTRADRPERASQCGTDARTELCTAFCAFRLR